MVPWGETNAGGRAIGTADGVETVSSDGLSNSLTTEYRNSDTGADSRGVRGTDGQLEEVTVPPTPTGVATALTYAAAAHRTTGPERSHPTKRAHPPLITIGEEVDVPDAIRERTPDSDVEFRLPDRLETLFVAAPLAYYLGARVTVEAGVQPTLSVPTADFEMELPELPTFQQSCANLLRKTFFLDCLVRDVDAEPPAEVLELRSELDLDPETIRDGTPGVRLAEYASLPDELVYPHLPDWHLSTYALPNEEHVRCLPYLLDSLSLVYLPEASQMNESELLDRTLDDSYRDAGPVASIDVLQPQLRAGRVHSWLAPGTPIDVCKTTPAAYENRHATRNQESDALRVTVVINDDEMGDEQRAAAEIYRKRATDLPIDLTVRESLTCEEVRSVFATPQDFVHFIGHCEADGLVCADGKLSLDSLEHCRARTFFLNACGSYHEGLDLVEHGAVAGAVTFTKVLDRHAAKVGTAFARLLVHGFEIERAMQLARRRILMGKDYAVVGDGTYALLPVGEPGVIWLADEGDRYEIVYEVLPTRRYGQSYSPPFDDTLRLHGNTSEDVLTERELIPLLEETSLPVIYNDEFHWSDALAAMLRE